MTPQFPTWFSRAKPDSVSSAPVFARSLQWFSSYLSIAVTPRKNVAMTRSGESRFAHRTVVPPLDRPFAALVLRRPPAQAVLPR